jgi:23S rRNA pseudouridine1911/1915/1917 synthase
MDFNEPYILEETGDFAVVYKPPKMHSAPQGGNSENTLAGWYSVKGGAGGSLADAGLLHRLDFDTHGLVLFAKNVKSFEFFKEQQDKGEFIKEYSALCLKTQPGNNLPGFPPPPAGEPLVISSYFRPFGPGRKEVRPVFEDGKKQREIAKDNGGFYRTEIINMNQNGDSHLFTVRIKRGFRHQIRCHLCWIGYPILGDLIYLQTGTNENLALRAHALFFTDPSGEKREYSIYPLTASI